MPGARTCRGPGARHQGQDGRRFWGVTNIGTGDKKTTEGFIGELAGKDNRTVVIADTDGYINGRLEDDNTLSFCYMQAGGRASSSVVSCTEVKRAR